MAFAKLLLAAQLWKLPPPHGAVEAGKVQSESQCTVQLSKRNRRRLAGFSGWVQGRPSALVFLLFCFAFLISVVSAQVLNYIPSPQSDQALGSGFTLSKLIGDALVKKEVNGLIYKEKCHFQADRTSYVSGPSMPSPSEQDTWKDQLRTEQLGECSVGTGRTGGLKLDSL